ARAARESSLAPRGALHSREFSTLLIHKCRVPTRSRRAWVSKKTSRSGTGTDTATAESNFVKAMTLTDATMLVAGTMIGSGIFIVSADIARKVQSPFWLIAVWVLTGIITLLGALAY